MATNSVWCSNSDRVWARGRVAGLFTVSLRDLVQRSKPRQHEILASLPCQTSAFQSLRRFCDGPISHIRLLILKLLSGLILSFCISAEEEGEGHQVSKSAQGPRAGRGHASPLLHAASV